MTQKIFPGRFFLTAIAVAAVSTVWPWAAVRAADPQPLPAEQLAEGWIALADGVSLFGWRSATEADWKVEDGAIVASGQAGLLRTTTQFSDFELRLQFQCEADARGGVYVRTSPEPKELPRDGFRVDISAAGQAHWQTLTVIALGPKITVQIGDGPATVSTIAGGPGRGFLALAGGQGPIRFRDIRLKPLAMQSLFNGKDLSGWKTYPNMAGRFAVTDKGEIGVRDGKGQLESAGSYGDFVLQFEAFCNGKELNSGVFFRCIPGDEMMGYECQIHNGFTGGDRNKPNNGGTGGIFRRQDARRVMSDDFAWISITLVAEGPHVATWVNGIQVLDWTDQRPPDPNPRKGLRLEPGTLMLQAHDPTTDLLFRALRIGEIRPRR